MYKCLSAYAVLILHGEPKEYLKAVTEYKSLDKTYLACVEAIFIGIGAILAYVVEIFTYWCYNFLYFKVGGYMAPYEPEV